jgi:hypothetical protein
MKTYLLSGTSGYDWSYFREILHARGYSPYPDGEYVRDGALLLKDGNCGIPYVDMLLVEMITEHGFDKNTYGIKCDWHSLHTGDSQRTIVRKDMLHDYLHDSGLIARTWSLDDFQYTGGVYILRPSSLLLSSGIDILIVNSVETWERARAFYATKIAAHSKYHSKSLQYYRVIVSEYIANPVLLNGRKFHIRLYGINFSDRDGFWIARGHGKILTAGKPFELANFDDKSVHDTHAKSTDFDYLFPDHYPRPEDLGRINEQLDSLQVLLGKLPRMQSYSQAQRSFHVFGLDIMVEGSRIILLEINDRIGYKENGPEFKKLCQLHAKWLESFLF